MAPASTIEMAQLVAAYTTHWILDALVTAAVARRCGFPILEISIGAGPAILKRKWSGILFAIRPLPIGNTVQIQERDAESLSASNSQRDRPTFVHLTMLFGSTFLLFLFYVAMAGGMRGVYWFWESYCNCFVVAIHPVLRGSATIAGTFDVLRSEGWLAVWACMGLGLIAFSLLPTAFGRGGALIFYLFPRFATFMSTTLNKPQAFIPLLVSIAFYVCWPIAVLSFFAGKK